MTELNLNSPEVQAAIKEHGLKPGKNGDAPVKPGSRKKLPKPAEPAAASEIKTKKFSVQLTAEQEARLIREASNKQMSALTYLQQLVEEQLSGNIGRAFVSGAGFMSTDGKKVTAPTNYFGREV